MKKKILGDVKQTADDPILITAKPPSVFRYLDPIAIVRNIWSYRDLIHQFTKREVLGKYKGTYLGILWSFINPLIMLAVYTFVFGIILNAKWGVGNQESKVEFALTLFSGMIVYGIFAECVSRAPRVIVENPNYVKKVVFPLEILPLSVLCSSLIHAVISLLILQSGVILFLQKISPTLYFFPIVIIPLVFLSLGLGWLLASLGVFIRDIGHTVNIVVTILFFMTPIFYPVTLVPNEFRWAIYLNPLTTIVEDSRKILIWGLTPDWNRWLVSFLFSIIVMQIGYIWFMKSKRAFADVI